jgi:hypothetical protein
LAKAFEDLYFTKKRATFRRLIHFFLYTEGGSLFGINKSDLNGITRHVTIEKVIRKCFSRIGENGVFVDSKSFFSCAAYALNDLIGKDESRFVIMNASPNEHVATPHDTRSFQIELEKQEYVMFDKYSNEDFIQNFGYISNIFNACKEQKINDYKCKDTYHFFLHECGSPFQLSDKLGHYLFMKRIDHGDNTISDPFQYPRCTK